MAFHKDLGRVLARLETETGCWIWPGAKNRGYGTVSIDGKQHGVHRFLYEQFRGPIPEGLQIDHLCRVKACANPAHLEAVTGKVNVLRGETITAANAAKTHCKRGHPLSGDNLCKGQKARQCRTCRNARQAPLYAARKTMPRPSERTHCPKGHPYSGENLGILQKGPSAGNRYCKECARQSSRASAARRKL